MKTWLRARLRGTPLFTPARAAYRAGMAALRATPLYAGLRRGGGAGWAGATAATDATAWDQMAALDPAADHAMQIGGPPLDLVVRMRGLWADDTGVWVHVELEAIGQRIDQARLRPLAGGDRGGAHGVGGDRAAPALAHPMPQPEVERVDPVLILRAYVATPVGRPPVLEVETGAGAARFLLLPRSRSWDDKPPPDPNPLARFANLVAGPEVEVLELGARHVTPTGAQRRAAFGPVKRWHGVDIHPGPGVDQVCDAHSLSGAVGPAGFDAVFSVAVMEHIRQPWIVSREINRVLRVGGHVFHQTHQTFPLHELPNDYWRYSVEAMKTLYGPDTGFAVVDVGYTTPVNLTVHPAVRHIYDRMPQAEAYSSVWIIARKTADLPDGAVVWPTQSDASAEEARRYPNRGAP